MQGDIYNNTPEVSIDEWVEIAYKHVIYGDEGYEVRQLKDNPYFQILLKNIKSGLESEQSIDFINAMNSQFLTRKAIKEVMGKLKEIKDHNLQIRLIEMGLRAITANNKDLSSKNTHAQKLKETLKGIQDSKNELGLFKIKTAISYNQETLQKTENELNV